MVFRREGRTEGDGRSFHTPLPSLRRFSRFWDRLNQDGSLSRGFVHCWSVDRGRKDNEGDNSILQTCKGCLNSQTTSMSGFMNLFRPGSAIPLFRCLADADSGICAALAFGKRARRMSSLPARAAVGNHIARGAAAQNLFRAHGSHVKWGGG